MGALRKLYYYKNHEYDSNGNLVQLIENGTGVPGERQTSFTYQTNGIRLETITDPLDHQTQMGYDSCGRLLSEEDHLGNITSHTYDVMNRLQTVTDPDGFAATTSYHWRLASGPVHAVFYIKQTGNDGSESNLWYDKLGRLIRKDVKGFNGAFIYTVTEYNAKGQVYRVSEPSANESPTSWNVFL